MTTSITESRPPTTVREIVRLKAQLYRDLRAIQAARADGGEIAPLRRRLVRRFVTEYQPALDDLLALTERPRLVAKTARLEERLTNGYSVPGPEAEALWKKLLLEYEVIADALAVGAEDERARPLPIFLARLALWDGATDDDEPAPLRTAPPATPVRDAREKGEG